jgi:hypothetical protein
MGGLADAGSGDAVINRPARPFPARLKANLPGLYRLLAARFAPQAAR